MGPVPILFIVFLLITLCRVERHLLVVLIGLFVGIEVIVSSTYILSLENTVPFPRRVYAFNHLRT